MNEQIATHDSLEQSLRVELESEKSKSEALAIEVADLKERIENTESVIQSENEVSIKSELNTFESLLEYEGLIYFV